MRPLYDDVIQKQGRWIRIYVGKREIQDPIEKNTISVNTVFVPIKVIIEDLTTTQAQYKMPGLKVSKVKDVILEYRHKALFEQSTQIEYEGEMYAGWKDNGKLQFREEPGVGCTAYLRLYIYSQKA